MTNLLYEEVFNVCSVRSQNLMLEALQLSTQHRRFAVNAVYVLMAVLAKPSAYVDVIQELEASVTSTTYRALKSVTDSAISSYVKAPRHQTYDESMQNMFVKLLAEHCVLQVSGETTLLQPVHIARAALESGSTPLRLARGWLIKEKAQRYQ